LDDRLKEGKWGVGCCIIFMATDDVTEQATGVGQSRL